MNIYKLPVDAYNRTHEQTISEDTIKDKLVGQKQKRKEIIDVIVDKDKMIESEVRNEFLHKTECM